MKTSLTPEEIEKIQSLLPGSQRPIQIGFHAKVRFIGKRYEDAICTLSSHYIGVFVPSKSKEDFEYHNISHISLVDSIIFKGEFVVINMGQKINLWIQSDYKIEFAQMLYRNYYLSFLLLESEDDIDFVFENEKNDDERNKYFPPINSIPISPSQQFQFNYFANCTEEEKAKYNHAAVRYVHSMITNKNTIFDASMLPDNLLNGKNAKENLRQIFAVLSTMKIISGICLSNYDCPDVISTFSSLIPNLRSLRIVHLSNCNATKGLDELAESIINASNLNVSYWDLSYNKFKNFKPFSTIISNSKKPIQYINLNYCEISHSGSTSFFNALSDFEFVKKLRYLSIAKMSLSDDSSIAAFRNFLKVAELFYIDLSSMDEEISAVLKVLTEEDQPRLRSLILNKLPLDDGAVFLINKLIKESNSLEELSLSGSNISPSNLASIITTVNENKNIQSFSLNLDKLNLYGKNLDLVLDAFSTLTSSKSRKKSKSKKKDNDKDEKEENDDDFALKWTKLSFASNSLDENDLDNLINKISKFKNLAEINLDDNFNSSMGDIDNILCRLLDFENLESISIVGSKNNRLKGKLIPLLDAIADSKNIQKLDIRNNEINDVSSIKKIVKKCKRLSVFRIDNNGFTDLDEIISAIAKSKKLIEFNFPLNDCKRLLKNVDKSDDKIINDIENNMRDLMATVEANRDDQGLYCELPFEVSNDVEQIITKLSSKAHKNLEKYKFETLTEHSFVTEIFHLPFPCQKLSMLLRNEREKSSLFSNSKIFYKKKSINQYGEIQECKVSSKLKNCYYAEDSMIETLVEYNDISGLYPEFFTSPVLSDQIKQLFDDLLQDQDRENENNSTKSTKNKTKSQRRTSSGKNTKKSIKMTNSDSEENHYDEDSDSDAQKNFNKTQKYLIRGKDNQAEDEKTRIQFRNADVREVDDLTLKLETRNIDNDKLDKLIDSSYNQVNEIKKKRTNIDEGVIRNNRGKDAESPSKEQAHSSAKTSSEKRSRIENNQYNKNDQRRKSNGEDDDSDKDKSIIMKKKRILSDPTYANSSSDDEHIEKLRRQNLRGSGKKKTNPPPQQQPQQQQPPPPQQPSNQRRNKKNEEEEDNIDKQKKVIKKKRMIIPSSESTSDDENVIKNQRIIPRNVAIDSENEEESDGNAFRNNKPSRNKAQQIISSSSDSEEAEAEAEANKRSKKRNSNPQQRKRQQQRRRQQKEQEEEEEDNENERRRQIQQQQQNEEQERRRQEQQEQERRRQEQQEQERLRQQERRRQQLEQEQEEQQKTKKKQTPPPPSKKDQTLKGLLNSSSEELSNSEEEMNKMPPKRNQTNQRPIQRPPNQPDPGLAMDYAHNLLEETERKPRPSKIPLYRKT